MSAALPLRGAAPADLWAAALRREFAKPVYDWRTPTRAIRAPHWLDAALRPLARGVTSVLQKVGGLLARLVHWLGSRLSLAPGPATSIAHPFQAWPWLLLAATAALLLALLWRLRGAAPAPAAAPPTAASVPIEQATGAEQSWDEWLRLCRQLESDGQYRLALRAAFLSCLAALHRDRWLQLRFDRTNREYVAEFRRRLALHPASAAAAAGRADRFARLAVEFDLVWYGNAPVTAEGLAAFLALEQEVAA